MKIKRLVIRSRVLGSVSDRTAVTKSSSSRHESETIVGYFLHLILRIRKSGRGIIQEISPRITRKMKRLVQQSTKGSPMSQTRILPILMFSAAIAFAADSFAWNSGNDSHMGNAIQAVTTGMPKLVTCPDGRRVPATPGCKNTIGTVTSGVPNLVECIGGQRVPAGKECPQPNNQNPKIPRPGYSR